MEIGIDELDSIPKEKYEELLDKYGHLIQQDMWDRMRQDIANDWRIPRKIMFGEIPKGYKEKQDTVTRIYGEIHTKFLNKFRTKLQRQVRWINNGCKIYKQTKRIIK